MTKYELPKMPYDFSALEPVISGQIMELHYTKHHQAYVNNLNAALEKYQEAESKKEIAAMIALEAAIKFNGGGHVNHSIFWTNLAPVGKGGGEPPKGELAQAIKTQFGSIEELIEKLSAKAVAIQGSGWAGWDMITLIIDLSLQPVLTKTLSVLKGMCPCLESTFGNMLTTFNTKMSVQTMLKIFGKWLIGIMWKKDF
jgi:Fe-Mn family superoxide dismutase